VTNGRRKFKLLKPTFESFGGLILRFGHINARQFAGPIQPRQIVGLAHMQSGLSDSATSSPSPSIAPLVVCVEAFFALGIFASLLPYVVVRRILAAVAHVALIFALLYLCHIGLPIVNIISKSILLIFIIYSCCWGLMSWRSTSVA
jgi:hypothetical protein